METYTHNLKIILFDSTGNIVIDNDFLDKIKNALCKVNTRKMQWYNRNMDITIIWQRKELTNIEKQFVGDLYSNPAYDIDSIIVNHTKQIISTINNESNYDINFYISRIIGNKTICRNSYGVI